MEKECRFIKKHNGILIGIDAEERLQSTVVDNHVTEKGVSKDLVDFWITNNETEEELKNKIIKLINDIL